MFTINSFKKTLILTCLIGITLGQSAQAMDLDEWHQNKAVWYQNTLDNIISKNKSLLVVKPIQQAVDAFRITTMNNKNKGKIRTAAIVSAFANLLVIGTKIYFTNSQHQINEPKANSTTNKTLIPAHIAKNIGSLFNLLLSLKIIKNAKQIAEYNEYLETLKSSNKKPLDTTALLSSLAVETISNLWPRLDEIKIRKKEKEVYPREALHPTHALTSVFDFKSSWRFSIILSRLTWLSRILTENGHINKAKKFAEEKA